MSFNPFRTKKTKRSNNSEPRKPEDINQEYLRLSSQLGELEFNYRTIPTRQEEIIERVKELQVEMQAAQEKAQIAVKQAQEAAAKVKMAAPDKAPIASNGGPGSSGAV